MQDIEITFGQTYVHSFENRLITCFSRGLASHAEKVTLPYPFFIKFIAAYELRMKHVPLFDLQRRLKVLGHKITKIKSFSISPRECRICALCKLDQDVVAV